MMGSQSLGAKTAQSVPHAGASATAAPGGERRLDLGCRGTPERSGGGMAGVVARSRSSVVLRSRPQRRSPQAFPGEEQRVGHRARFPRPGYAQGHEEKLQQKGRGMALAASPGGSGSGQPGCLEEGAVLAAHFRMVSSHGCLSLIARPRPLGPKLGIPITGVSGKRPAQCSHQGELDRPGHAGHAFHHE